MKQRKLSRTFFRHARNGKTFNENCTKAVILKHKMRKYRTKGMSLMLKKDQQTNSVHLLVQKRTRRKEKTSEGVWILAATRKQKQKVDKTPGWEAPLTPITLLDPRKRPEPQLELTHRKNGRKKGPMRTQAVVIRPSKGKSYAD